MNSASTCIVVYATEKTAPYAGQLVLKAACIGDVVGHLSDGMIRHEDADLARMLFEQPSRPAEVCFVIREAPIKHGVINDARRLQRWAARGLSCDPAEVEYVLEALLGPAPEEEIG